MYAPGLRQSKRILNKFNNTKPQFQPFPLPVKHVNESDDEDDDSGSPFKIPKLFGGGDDCEVYTEKKTTKHEIH